LFQLFADRGVMAIEHADFDGIERLALVTGGEIVSTFGNPELVKIGRCDLIEQVNTITYPVFILAVWQIRIQSDFWSDVAPDLQNSYTEAIFFL
jgi:hypothetical protein